MRPRPRDLLAGLLATALSLPVLLAPAVAAGDTTGSPVGRSVLLALSSHHRLGDTDRKTGFYVPEAAHAWKVFRTAGYQVDLVSPRGGAAPQDGLKPNDPIQDEFLADPEMRRELRNTLRPEQVLSYRYRAVFYVGGHGTMWDFPDDRGLARIAERIYLTGGVVSAVCHGPAGLVNLRLPSGRYLVAGRRVAAFTNSEERAQGLEKVVPFLLADRLTQRGARQVAAPDRQANTVVDGRLVTGQNPASATGTAQAVVRVLGGR